MKNEAPERIWAGRVEGYGQWWEGPDIVGRTSYTRTDIADAQVAAAYERAADWCRDHTMGAVTNQRDAEYCGVYASDEQTHKPLGKHQGMAYAEAIRALATDTQTDALEQVRVEERNDTLKRVNGYCTDCETAAIVNSDGRCVSCGSGRTWPLREPAKQALEAEKEKADRAGYERGAREALSRMLPNFDEDSRAKIIEAAYRNYKQMRQGASGQIITEWDGIESHVVEATRAAILALLDNPTHTPDPDEPTEADQDLAFRKAVSS